MESYQVKSPVLFLIFNRPDTTERVFNEIRSARPSKLYIAADGARQDRIGETNLCEATRSAVSHIDWDCEVKTLFRTKNIGCKEAVSSAISWFFDQEEEGIILEDDCLPSNSFFSYCDELLEKYRFDTRIRHIAGCNLQLGRKWGEASYYFANQTHVWGWASWRRVWKDYDKELSAFNEEEAFLHINKIFDDPLVAEEWKKIFGMLKKDLINTWDYQLAIINFFNNSLSINPNFNLISNIGFRADGTHTLHSDNPYANLPLQEIGKLEHPKFVLPEKEADYAVFNRDFDLDRRHKKNKTLKRWLKRLFRVF